MTFDLYIVRLVTNQIGNKKWSLFELFEDPDAAANDFEYHCDTLGILFCPITMLMKDCVAFVFGMRGLYINKSL